MSLALLVLLGAVLRFAALEVRPIHADEAVQAFIFAELLEGDRYLYDPQHYHGPLPHYLNRGLMPLLGVQNLAQMQVWHLRLLAALAGSAVVLLCALSAGAGWHRAANDLWGAKNKSVALRAALLAALSPLGLYYSRMGIHETLLVLLALLVPLLLRACLKATQSFWRQLLCALLLGLSLGALHATKETWCIVAFSWVVACGVLAPRQSWQQVVACCKSLQQAGLVVLAIVSAFATSAALYSGFGQNWRGLADAWLALLGYRTGSGHNQPWYYYLEQVLGFYRSGNGIWGEGVLVVFALAAAVALCWQRRKSGAAKGAVSASNAGSNTAAASAGSNGAAVSADVGSGAAASAGSSVAADGVGASSGAVVSAAVADGGDADGSAAASAGRLSPIPFLPRFLALSALVQIVVYSCISYKTPWLMLVAVAYLVPLAAWGWQMLAGRFSHHFAVRLLLWVFVLAGSGVQAWLGSFVYPTDTRIAFVYAPTLPQADAQLRHIAAQFEADARQTGALTAVVGGNYWPLPWYFRSVTQQVGYFEKMPPDSGDFSLLICEGSAGGGQLLELRPGYLLRAGAPADVLPQAIPLKDGDYFQLGQ